MQIDFPDKLYKNISSYCTLNNLDMFKYIENLFMKDKYGDKPCIPTQLPLQPTIVEEKPTEKKKRTYTKKKVDISPVEKEQTTAIIVDVKKDNEVDEIETTKIKHRKLK